MLNVIFRADASSFIGGGHVMRCLTLADALSHSGWQCSFACTEATVEMMPFLLRSEHQVISTGVPDYEVDLLVVDHYALDDKYEAGCRAWAKHILVIDDLADRRHDCDLLMDQTLGRSANDYKDLVPEHCDVMTGARYALLRPQFAEKREESLGRRKSAVGDIRKVLVMLGAGDKDNVTGLVLEALEGLAGSLDVDVIMGANAPHLELIKGLTQNSHHNINVYAGIEDVASLMASADLAIGAGGTASWERCCLGLPTLVIEIADNQRKIIQEIVARGAAISVGHYKDIVSEDIVKAVERLQNTPSIVAEMGIKAAGVSDGQGVARLVQRIETKGVICEF